MLKVDLIRDGGEINNIMRFSTYNIYWEEENHYWFIFNCFTKASVAITDTIFRNIKKCKFHLIEDSLLEKLQKNGILIRCKDEEKEHIDFIIKEQAYSANEINLTLYPTYDCNFGCEYCYEAEERFNKLNSGDMTEDVESNLILWLDKYILGRGVVNANLRIYGGEPLLRVERFKSLSSNVFSLLSKHGVIVKTHLITNGSLINKEIVEYLDSINIQQVQVTIDGSKHHHDLKRHYKNGVGSYDDIIENLNSIIDYKINVMVRMNFDSTNLSSAYELINDLYERKLTRNNNLFFELNPIVSRSNWDGLMCKAELDENLIDIRLAILRYAIDKGLRIRNPFNVAQCFAVTAGTFSIEPSGNIFNCYNLTCDNQYMLGNVYTRVFNSFYYKIINSDVRDEDCYNCRYMPLCLGGCRASSLFSNNGKIRKVCQREYYDAYVMKVLKVYYSQYLKKENSRTSSMIK